MSVWKTHVTFDVSQRSDILKLVFLMYIYLDRWIDRQIDGWMDGWMERQIDKQTDRQVDRYRNGCEIFT